MLLVHLFLIRNCEGRLDVVSSATTVTDKIDLKPFADHFSFFIFFCMFDNAYIYTKSSDEKLVINDIFHDMIFFLLSKIQLCIAKTYVGEIILKR